MSLLFALGSACFLIGPFPGYAALAGATAVAVTFAAGSVLFTAGGALQTWAAAPGRHDHGTGRTAWWVAVLQSAGTLFFTVSTFRAVATALSSTDYDRLVWRPDVFGSLCFLASGALAYRVSARHDRLAAVNLLGCALFGVAAVAGYVAPATGVMISETVSGVGTSAGAACFLACALPGLRRRH